MFLGLLIAGLVTIIVMGVYKNILVIIFISVIITINLVLGICMILSRIIHSNLHESQDIPLQSLNLNKWQRKMVNLSANKQDKILSNEINNFQLCAICALPENLICQSKCGRSKFHLKCLINEIKQKQDREKMNNNQGSIPCLQQLCCWASQLLFYQYKPCRKCISQQLPNVAIIQCQKCHKFYYNQLVTAISKSLSLQKGKPFNSSKSQINLIQQGVQTIQNIPFDSNLTILCPICESMINKLNEKKASNYSTSDIILGIDFHL